MERKNNIISILKTENGKAVLNDIGPEILAELVKRRDQFMEQYNTLSEKKQFQSSLATNSTISKIVNKIITNLDRRRNQKSFQSLSPY